MGCCRGLEDTRRFSANGLLFSGYNSEFYFSFSLLLVVFIPLLSPVVSECLGNAQMFTGLICWQWLVDPSFNVAHRRDPPTSTKPWPEK